jgi:hypothetical protein
VSGRRGRAGLAGVFLALVGAALHLGPAGPLYKHILPMQRWTSPDGSQLLTAYRLPLLHAMPGGGGDARALVELQWAPGMRLAGLQPPEDDILYRDVAVEWEAERVWVGVARAIERPRD